MKRSLLALVVIVLAASAARADVEQAYRAGVSAYSRSRWPETISAMKQAIAERPAESASTILIYGTWYEPYVPHYYLGMALFKAGRCAEATPELAESQRQRVLPKKYVSGVEQALMRCASEAPPATTTTAITTTQPIPPPPPTITTPATNTATTATTVTTTVAPPPIVPDRTAQLSESRKALASATQRARKTLVAVPKNASPREASLLRVRMRRAESLALSDSVENVSTATRDLISATDDLEAWIRSSTGITVTVPTSLIVAVDAYLRGDYAASLNTSSGAMFADPRLRAQALLFRAASAHALFVLGHERDKSLYTRALNDVVEYKRLPAAASIDRRIFSPAFVDFVQRAGS